MNHSSGVIPSTSIVLNALLLHVELLHPQNSWGTSYCLLISLYLLTHFIHAPAGRNGLIGLADPIPRLASVSLKPCVVCNGTIRSKCIKFRILIRTNIRLDAATFRSHARTSTLQLFLSRVLVGSRELQYKVRISSPFRTTCGPLCSTASHTTNTNNACTRL